MKVRSKESGKVYDIDAVFVKGGELILPLSDVEILLDEQPATLEETESYDYEELRNVVAAKLYIRYVEQNSPAVSSNLAIEEANHFISELKKSPVE